LYHLKIVFAAVDGFGFMLHFFASLQQVWFLERLAGGLDRISLKQHQAVDAVS